jgi:negative regulator of sigma-B (phosphoserine phosphatase)
MIKQINFNHVNVCAYQHPKKGNVYCGDGFFMNETDEYFICAVADGLGSGKKAKDSSALAMDMVNHYQECDLEFIMNKCNEALVNERGAVLSIFKWYFKDRELYFSTVGNIQFFLHSPGLDIINPLPSSGFLTGRPQSIKVKNYTLIDSSSFIIYSDGLKLRSTKQFLKDLTSPIEASRQLQENIHQPLDDVTFLIGNID